MDDLKFTSHNVPSDMLSTRLLRLLRNIKHSGNNIGNQLGIPIQNDGVGFELLMYQKPMRFQRVAESGSGLTGFSSALAGSIFSSV
jgi:hypothetical protein